MTALARVDNRTALEPRNFGRWSVIGEGARNKWNQRTATCRCDCGTVRDVARHQLLKGVTRSCGCLAKEMAAAKLRSHGEVSGGKESPEYNCWKQMIARCHRRTAKAYPNWGGRGIGVCDRWRASFANFLADMGRRPSSAHSIDRKDNDGHYEPGNCRWATSEEQLNNTRANRMVTFKGETLSVSQWARRLVVCDETIRGRLERGWPVELALTAPKGFRR